MYRLKPTYNNFYGILSISDETPKLYDLMNSKINYNNSNPVDPEDLPKEFRNYLFDFEYPLNNNLKEEFELMFLNHFMFRRIGYETYTAWKINLKVKLCEIMPKYNKMFEGFNLLDFLGNQETHIKTLNETGNSVGNTTNDNRFSNVPQNEIDDIKNGNYMTDYTYNQGTSNSNANRNSNESIKIDRLDTIDEYKKFKETVNNIYSDIFKELNCLFFSVV